MKAMIGVLAVVALSVPGNIYAMNENTSVPQATGTTPAASVSSTQGTLEQKAFSALGENVNVVEETKMKVVNGQNEQNVVVRNTIVATPAAPRVQNTIRQNKQSQATAAAKAKAAQEIAAKKAAAARAAIKAAKENANNAAAQAAAKAAQQEAIVAAARARAAQKIADAQAQAEQATAFATQEAADNAFAAFESSFVAPEALNNISAAAEQSAQDVEETLSPSAP